MIPQRNDNHVEEGAKLLTGQYRDKPIISGVLRALLAGEQRLEQEIWELIWGWVLEHEGYHASGQQLDDLGAIVGQPREGRSDVEYILAIRTRMRILRSKGRSEDMVQVTRLINEAAEYSECFPLGWIVQLYNIPNGGQVIRLLAQAKAATSYGNLVTSNWPEEDVLRFTHVGGSSTRVRGSIYSPETALKRPCVLPTNPPYQRQS